MRAPALSCDCHMHVFGSADLYPLGPKPAYEPRPASLEDYRRMAEPLGLERIVLVQPSAYGTDNRCMLDTMREAGTDRCRGVAVIDEETPRETLDQMHELGVRGVRLNLRSTGRDQVDELRETFPRIAARVARLGWHVQIFASLGVLAAVAELFRRSPVPVVLDHMAAAKAAAGGGQSGLSEVLALAGEGLVWTKLSGAYRISQREPDFADARPIMERFIAANPERVVWGSDWPHIGPHRGPVGGVLPPVVYRNINDRRLLDMLAAAAGTDETSRRILVDNPAALYGFPSAT